MTDIIDLQSMIDITYLLSMLDISYLFAVSDLNILLTERNTTDLLKVTDPANWNPVTMKIIEFDLKCTSQYQASLNPENFVLPIYYKTFS